VRRVRRQAVMLSNLDQADELFEHIMYSPMWGGRAKERDGDDAFHPHPNDPGTLFAVRLQS
jgi:hypothetical protein